MTLKKAAFSKTGAKKLVATIKKDLKVNVIAEDKIVKEFSEYLISKKVECIITNKEKVIFTCGKRLKQYLNANISDYLKEILNNKYNPSLCSIWLEITNNKRIKGIYLYNSIKAKRKYNGENLGCIIYIYTPSSLHDMLEIRNKFEF